MSTASADDLMMIRCVGYAEPIVLFPSPKILGFSENDEPFDVYLKPSQGIGWWHGAVFSIDEKNPAKLEVSPSQYRLDAESTTRGMKAMEWIVLDRVDGSIVQAGRLQEGAPVGELKRGGHCSKVEPRF